MEREIPREPVDVLVFEVGDKCCGLPVSAIQELVRAVAITSVPRASELLEGVINLRGRLVPVFDLRARLGLPPKPVHPSDHFIVARARSRTIVLRVDRAADLVRLEPHELEIAHPVVPGIGYVSAAAPGGLLLIHAPAELLDPNEAQTLDMAVWQYRLPLEER